MYIVSLNISICYEANGPCALDLKILQNNKLPIPFCDFSQGFPGKITILLGYLFVSSFKEFHNNQINTSGLVTQKR